MASQEAHKEEWQQMLYVLPLVECPCPSLEATDSYYGNNPNKLSSL